MQKGQLTLPEINLQLEIPAEGHGRFLWTKQGENIDPRAREAGKSSELVRGEETDF